jgi:hypothetical protein
MCTPRRRPRARCSGTSAQARCLVISAQARSLVTSARARCSDGEPQWRPSSHGRRVVARSRRSGLGPHARSHTRSRTTRHRPTSASGVCSRRPSSARAVFPARRPPAHISSVVVIRFAVALAFHPLLAVSYSCTAPSRRGGVRGSAVRRSLVRTAVRSSSNGTPLAFPAFAVSLYKPHLVPEPHNQKSSIVEVNPIYVS